MIQTKGIVFRTTKYGESSLIVEIYTEELGIQSYIINGVRSKNAKTKAAVLQLMSLIDMEVYNSKRNLNRIKEVRISHPFRDLVFNPRKSTAGLFVLELARKSVKEIETNKDLFHFLWNSLIFLDKMEVGVSNFPLCFMIQFSSFLGFYPNMDQELGKNYFNMYNGGFEMARSVHPMYSMTEEQSQLLIQFLQKGWESCREIQMDTDTHKAFLLKLIDYYKLHIEKMPPLNATKLFLMMQD